MVLRMRSQKGLGVSGRMREFLGTCVSWKFALLRDSLENGMHRSVQLTGRMGVLVAAMKKSRLPLD